MSRQTDISALRVWVMQGKIDDPSMSSLILRVCDHAETAKLDLARDWGAVRNEAVIRCAAAALTHVGISTDRAAEIGLETAGILVQYLKEKDK